MRVGVIVVSVIAAVVTWLLALGIAASVPGSPFYEMYGVIDRLRDPVSGQSAFGEFLKLGERTKWLSATIFPILSAAVVALLSRWRFRLRRNEVVAVTVVFLGFVVLFGSGLRLA